MVMSTRRAQCLPRVASNTLPTKEKEDVLGMLGLCLSFPFRFHFIFYALAFNPCRRIVHHGTGSAKLGFSAISLTNHDVHAECVVALYILHVR